MTNQEVFSTVVKHLYEQGARAVFSETGSCAYRGERGRKCAIGRLIPDDEYVREMEHKSVQTIVDEFKVSTLQGVNVDLLFNLQEAHDKIPHWGVSGPTPLMSEELGWIADYYHLDMPS